MVATAASVRAASRAETIVESDEVEFGRFLCADTAAIGCVNQRTLDGPELARARGAERVLEVGTEMGEDAGGGELEGLNARDLSVELGVFGVGIGNA